MRARVLDGNGEFRLTPNHHVDDRWIAPDPGYNCAFLQDVGRQPRNASAWATALAFQSQFGVENDEPPQMDQPVLVLIPELMESQ